MTYEDFTTYTEKNGDIAKTATTCTVTSMRRDADAYLYKNFGVGHFGDFEHLFGFALTDAEAGDVSDRNYADIHVLSNGIGSVNDYDEDWIGVKLVQDQDLDDTTIFRLMQKENGVIVDSDISSTIVGVGFFSYMTIERSGTTCTLKIYMDNEREELIETLTITCTTTAYRYLHVVRSEEASTDPADHISFYFNNLDNVEPAIDPPTVTTQDATDKSWKNATYWATLHGTITDTGGEDCVQGFEWGSSSGNYTEGYELPGTHGVGPFERTDSFSGTVYFRAYARNSAGESPGSEKSFTPPPPPVDPPTVTTQDATDKSWKNATYWATLHGTITDTGGEDCVQGFEWGSSSGNYTEGYELPGTHGVGPFERTDSFSGTVYFRAYARNSAGESPGSEKSFTPPPPDVVTMIGGPTGWEWGVPEKSVSTVRITSDGGLTSIWGLAVGTITIPSGGPLGWEWKEVEF